MTWRNSPVTVVVSGAAILLALGFLYKTLAKPAVPSIPLETVCEKCGQSGIRLLKGDERDRMPLPCPACGARAVYLSVKCKTCGESYAAKPPMPTSSSGVKFFSGTMPVPPSKGSRCPACDARKDLPGTPPKGPDARAPSGSRQGG